MFKNVYTTRMSDDGKTLERRFKSIILKPWRLSKSLSIACILVVLAVVCFCALLFAGMNNDVTSEKTTKAYEQATEIYEESYVTVNYDNMTAVGVTVLCNGHTVNLQNTPFIITVTFMFPWKSCLN